MIVDLSSIWLVSKQLKLMGFSAEFIGVFIDEIISVRRTTSFVLIRLIQNDVNGVGRLILTLGEPVTYASNEMM